jgi:hypothetical protein
MFWRSCERQECRSDRVQVLFQVDFPEAQHVVTAGIHVCVLRAVEADPPALPRVRHRETHGVAMPIVSIELDDQPVCRQEGVNDELAANSMLREVEEAQRVEQCVADPLGGCAPALLLLPVHFQKLFPTGGVCVATSKRAILYVVRLVPRRGPPELLPADRADVRGFVPALPDVDARGRAEPRFPVEGDVEGFVANKAVGLVPVAPVGSTTFPGTTGLTSAAEPGPKGVAAGGTGINRQAGREPLTLAATMQSETLALDAEPDAAGLAANVAGAAGRRLAPDATIPGHFGPATLKGIAAVLAGVEHDFSTVSFGSVRRLFYA